MIAATESPPQEFHCPKSMRVDCERVFRGEYDIAYEHPAPVVLDVGANVGSFALWARWRWPGSVIHCYEPLPFNLECLGKNVGSMPEIVVHPHAIGNPEHTRLRLGKHSCGEPSFFDIGEQLEEYVEVVSQWPNVMPEAQILKLDVEGAEVEILEHAQIRFDAIMLEYHSEANRRRVDRILRDYVLVGSHVYCPNRGVVRYLRQSLVK